MRSERYILWGDPQPFARQSEERKVWDEARNIYFNRKIELEYLHEGKPLFKAPIILEIDFYLPKPKPKSTVNHCMLSMLEFTKDLLEQTIIKEKRLIYKLIANKHWDLLPRTDIIITELENK